MALAGARTPLQGLHNEYIQIEKRKPKISTARTSREKISENLRVRTVGVTDRNANEAEIGNASSIE